MGRPELSDFVRLEQSQKKDPGANSQSAVADAPQSFESSLWEDPTYFAQLEECLKKDLGADPSPPHSARGQADDGKPQPDQSRQESRHESSRPSPSLSGIMDFLDDLEADFRPLIPSQRQPSADAPQPDQSQKEGRESIPAESELEGPQGPVKENEVENSIPVEEVEGPSEVVLEKEVEKPVPVVEQEVEVSQEVVQETPLASLRGLSLNGKSHRLLLPMLRYN